MPFVIKWWNQSAQIINRSIRSQANCLPLIFRLSTFRLLFIFSFLFLLLTCGFDVENPNPPSPPIWIQKSLPEEWPERGIDAHESGGIFLEWEPSQREDIIAYNIYRATWYEVNDSIGPYELLVSMDVESALSLNFIDREVQPRTLYYYKLRAKDDANYLSAFSDSLFYSLFPPLLQEWMIPNGRTVPLSIQRTLIWEFGLFIELEGFCVTILTDAEELVMRSIILPGNYTNGRESWSIPNDIELTAGNVYHWRVDTSAKFLGDRETAGSESPWATFLYVGS
jgi:hypothetical protein